MPPGKFWGPLGGFWGLGGVRVPRKWFQGDSGRRMLSVLHSLQLRLGGNWEKKGSPLTGGAGCGAGSDQVGVLGTAVTPGGLQPPAVQLVMGFSMGGEAGPCVALLANQQVRPVHPGGTQPQWGRPPGMGGHPRAFPGTWGQSQGCRDHPRDTLGDAGMVPGTWGPPVKHP